MAARDVVAVRPVGSWTHRSAWYRSLAYALACGRPPCGAVFEANTTLPIPANIVRPPEIVDALYHSGHSERLLPVPVPSSLEPTVRGRGLLGMVVRTARAAEPAPDESSLPPELPSLPALVQDGGWIGVQTLWLQRGGGRLALAVRCRVVAPDRERRDRLADAVAARVLRDWTHATRSPARMVWRTAWPLGEWRRGTVGSLPPEAWFDDGPGTSLTPEVGLSEFQPPESPGGAHTVVFGASGSGKTTFLAAEAVRAIAAGSPVVVLDLHGDLAPRVLAQLGERDRARVIAVDAGEPPVPGISGLRAGGPSPDRAAAHFVAAVKRLSPDGTELAWGFRLERIFDTFSRLVLETGGSLLDLYALLTDSDRRDAARLTTRRPSTARFLDELGPILRRDPEFLWSAATRLSKIVLVPALVDLLAPADGGLDAEGLLAAGRPLLLRLPMATLGPESAAFAATLVLGRLYLGLAARNGPSTLGRTVLVVLDEVQSLSPRLVAEILSEGRKFGVEAIVATQYPDRLTPEVRSAAAGAAGAFVSFRVPYASVASVAPWLGLSPYQGASLTSLPVSVGLRSVPDQGGTRWVRPPAGTPVGALAGWREALGTTRTEFVTEQEAPLTWDEPATERVLLAILAADEAGHRLGPAEVVAAAARIPGASAPSERLDLAWTSLARGPEVEWIGTGVRLSAAGERRIGLGRSTDATRETAEHRGLLLRTFRIFARQGYVIEILRQGRFDTTLPDAIFRQLGRAGRSESPAELTERIDRARTGWAWRFFGGRDVHIEAEVSGAERPERIRHGWAKAAGRGAFALFVVSTPERARRVRRTLRAVGLGPNRAQVWTLSDDRGRLPPNP